ncbi:MAG: hypothetical protein JXM70_28910 [Pirellulales bacterium]|nr:hypothetical protein [Pirellulales bacterium]
MGKTIGIRSGVSFSLLFSTITFTAILSTSSLLQAQDIELLPEVIPAPAAQTAPSTPLPIAVQSNPISESLQYSAGQEPSQKYSATLNPIFADESGKVVTIASMQDPLEEPGIHGWFVQVDGFWWRESIEVNGERFKLLEETGPMFSVGYQARKPRQRYRIAIFGGSPDYDGATWDNEPLTSKTDYFGVVGEYDFRWPLLGSPTNGFFAGVGTRWWSRNLQNSYTEEGNLSLGYRETWWTIYPRIGIDSMVRLRNGMHLYMSGSLGFTAYTSENIDFFEVTLEPESDVYTRAEIGLRNRRLSVSFMLEHLGWKDSDADKMVYQPRSTMLTAGVLFGYNF